MLILKIMFFFFCSIEVLDREALGISNIIRNLLTYFPPNLMVTLPEELLYNFLEHVTRLTCFFTEGAAHEESVRYICMCVHISIFFNFFFFSEFMFYFSRFIGMIACSWKHVKIY